LPDTCLAEKTLAEIRKTLEAGAPSEPTPSTEPNRCAGIYGSCTRTIAAASTLEHHQPDQARPGERHDKRSNPAVRALDGYCDRIEAC
jgi:hypothetical protein